MKWVGQLYKNGESNLKLIYVANFYERTVAEYKNICWSKDPKNRVAMHLQIQQNQLKDNIEKITSRKSENTTLYK